MDMNTFQEILNAINYNVTLFSCTLFGSMIIGEMLGEIAVDLTGGHRNNPF